MSPSVRRASGKTKLFVLSDCNSEVWEKIENVSLEIHSQIFEKTRGIQYPVLFITGENKTTGTINGTRT